MAITRETGTIVCSDCDNSEAIFFLSASNMPRRLEALPVGWAEWAGRYVCGDHDEEGEIEAMEQDAIDESPTWHRGGIG